MKPFIDDDFLLQTGQAVGLYREHARDMPIFDYHCHLPAVDISEDRRFENLTRIWLNGDHYKWRAMRANGIEELFITGDADDASKFMKWAETVPYTVRNPLYHWTHLELRMFFGIGDRLLGPDTARGIYDEASAMLKSEKLSVRNILRQRKVRVVCTTDDPCDSLEHHRKIKADGFEVKVLPAFRPDKAMAVADAGSFKAYVEKLGSVSGISIVSMKSFLSALDNRHSYFHEQGCRISDHGLATVPLTECASSEAGRIFKTALRGKDCSKADADKFAIFMLLEFGRMDHARGWTQQLHLGVLRNNNSRMFRLCGPDTGFDSIGDFRHAEGLGRFLDALDREGRLPRTILYNINPCDNEIFAAMAGNFQEAGTAGKIQFGAGWWFLDQMDGMERQMDALSNMGLLSRFVRMLTDSRSFLSYARHDYFRRILCAMLGRDMQAGLIPDDADRIGSMVRDVCFNNAAAYFGIRLD